MYQNEHFEPVQLHYIFSPGRYIFGPDNYISSPGNYIFSPFYIYSDMLSPRNYIFSYIFSPHNYVFALAATCEAPWSYICSLSNSPECSRAQTLFYDLR
jgi:hypothetical protein